jgi:glycosyltransferase involved in cell wall biosynthesis
VTPSSPRVSVIITVHKRVAFLPEAIDSVLGQSYQDFEVIVVEDGSDTAKETVERYGERVRYVWQAQKGVGPARNTGARVAAGAWLAFLDDDDWWAPQKLERQIALAQEWPDLGVIHTEYVDVEDGTIQPRWHTYAPHEMPSGWVTGALFLRFMGLPSTVMVRREAFDRVGGFNPGVRFSEDYDLWLRLSTICPFGYLAEPLVMRRRHRGSLSDNERAVDVATAALLTHTLAVVPTLWDECGADAVKDCLHRLHLRCGRLLFWENRHPEAREHLLTAWQLRPLRPLAPAYALASLWPAPLLALARRVTAPLRKWLTPRLAKRRAGHVKALSSQAGARTTSCGSR